MPTPSPFAPAPADVSAEVALAHAVRRWEAEEENARRLNSRGNGLLAFAGGLFALAVARLGELDPLESEGLFWVVRVLFTAALSFLLWGAAVLLQVSFVGASPGSTRLASAEFHGWKREAGPPFRLSPLEARSLDWALTMKASNELHRLNVAQVSRIARAQSALVYAAGAALLAILCYSCGERQTTRETSRIELQDAEEVQNDAR